MTASSPGFRQKRVPLLLCLVALACGKSGTSSELPDPSRARVVLHTSAGDLTLSLFPRQAPRTVEQFLRLARAGVFDTTHLFSIAPGFLVQSSWAYDRSRRLSEAQRSLIRRIPLEAGAIKHQRGVLSMSRDAKDPDSGETSYCIMLGPAPQMDGKYTVFGQVESGFDVLAEIEKLGTEVATRPRGRVEISQVVVVDDAWQLHKEVLARPKNVALAAQAAPAPEPEMSPSCHPAQNGDSPPAHRGDSAPAASGQAMASPPARRSDTPVAISDRVEPSGRQVRTVLFRDLHIEGLYPSMHGPWSQKAFKLAPTSPRVWLTGYRAEVLEGGTGRASQEFMCHTNLDLIGTASAPPGMREARAQLSISQGQTELRFPRGFGLPLANDENREVRLTAMVLNSNYPDLDKKLDFRSTIRYLDDQTARKERLKPLFQTSVYTVCPTEPARDPNDPTPVCEPATPWEVHAGPYARRQTGHWIVPPGRQEITHDVTAQLDLPYDTTVHYIWVHLHPYGQRMELRDTTTGKTVWSARARNHPSKAILLATDSYSSTEGIPLYKDHAYELTTVYDNSSGKRVTAMAAFWMYLRQREDGDSPPLPRADRAKPRAGPRAASAGGAGSSRTGS
jgi:cyclophilin family peptidyl-prolyl cis-trans isomerase